MNEKEQIQHLRHALHNIKAEATLRLKGNWEESLRWIAVVAETALALTEPTESETQP